MVLGTKFNVRSYSVEDRHVTLVNGKVQVTNTVNNKSVTLRPGQDLTYTETGEEKVSEVNIATYTAWTEECSTLRMCRWKKSWVLWEDGIM